MAMATKAKRATKLDRLLEQGEWVAVQMDGNDPPCRFVMPTEELRAALEKELEKKIKKHLKEDGFERICATRREHPFYTETLRERIDHLADVLSSDHREFSTDERAEASRLDLLTCIEETKHHIAPITEYDIEKLVEKGRKDALRAWARAINQYREYLRDPKWWQGTYLERALNPPEQPPLPDRLPKPVYVNKERPDLVIQLLDGSVNLYTRVAA
jgi:hypothetical protein